MTLIDTSPTKWTSGLSLLYAKYHYKKWDAVLLLFLLFRCFPLSDSPSRSRTHLIIIPRRHAPEIGRPRPHNQRQHEDKEAHADLPIPLALLAALERLPPLINDVALAQPLLLRPLQPPQIDVPETRREQRRRDDDRPRRQHDVHDDDVVVRVVVAVLNDAGDDAHDDVHAVVDGDLDRVAGPEDLLVPHRRPDAVDDDGGAKREGHRVDAKGGRRAADRGAPRGQAHGQQHAEAADEHEREAVAEQVHEDADERHEEEAEILRHGAVPPSRHGVDLEALLGQLGGVLRVDDGGAGLEERKEDDAPEGPGEAQHLAELELLVLLGQLLARSRVGDARVALVAPPREEPEDERCDVGEEVHEDGRPVHPAEVAGLLRDDVGGGFADEGPDLADSELEA